MSTRFTDLERLHTNMGNKASNVHDDRDNAVNSMAWGVCENERKELRAMLGEGGNFFNIIIKTFVCSCEIDNEDEFV